MMFKREARIRSLTLEEGGRPSPPPGPVYSTVARFESLADRWPHEAWSVVLSISAPLDADGIMIAGIRMLAGDDAPKQLLDPGSRFELYEGRQCVAHGEVV